MKNRRRLGVAILIVAALGLYREFARQDQRTESLPTLRVLAYNSFTGVTGPGPQLAEQFGKRCHCRVELLSAGDAGMILENLRFTRKSAPSDVVIGLDQLRLTEAESLGAWQDIQLKEMSWAPEIQSYARATFVPVEWSPLTFIYRRGEIDPPKAPRDLLGPNLRHALVLEDPRLSTPGQQWIFAFNEWFLEEELRGAFKTLSLNLVSMAPSWSSAYGLFQRGQAKLVFSYVTSLLYHWSAEKNFVYEAANFKEGHPLQVEFAAIPIDSRSPELARTFIEFILSPESQKWIATKNFMWPARASVDLPEEFNRLPKLSVFNPERERAFISRHQEVLKLWREIFQ